MEPTQWAALANDNGKHQTGLIWKPTACHLYEVRAPMLNAENATYIPHKVVVSKWDNEQKCRLNG